MRDAIRKQAVDEEPHHASLRERTLAMTHEPPGDDAQQVPLLLRRAQGYLVFACEHIDEGRQTDAIVNDMLQVVEDIERLLQTDDQHRSDTVAASFPRFWR